MSEIVKQSEPLILFLSYAHEDEKLLQELATHLSLLRWQGPIITWNTQHIGAEWVKTNNERLEQASIVLLLVSPYFLASDDCYKIAMRARQRQETDQVRCFPFCFVPLTYQMPPSRCGRFCQAMANLSPSGLIAMLLLMMSCKAF